MNYLSLFKFVFSESFCRIPKLMRKLIFFFLLVLMLPMTAKAQRVSLGTDLLQLVNFGTVNINAGVSVARRVSLDFGARYNPWDFHDKQDVLIRNQQTTGWVGVKYWPWYVFSGWWVEGKMQYSDISRTGVWRPALEDSQRVGLGASFGYTIMLTENLNLDIGAGFWGGRSLKHTLYECPVCMDVRETGPCYFVDLDAVNLSLIYIF